MGVVEDELVFLAREGEAEEEELQKTKELVRMTGQMERWPNIQTVDQDGWSMGEWKYVEERRKKSLYDSIQCSDPLYENTLREHY